MKNLEETRREKNKELIRRMKSGEKLWAFDSQASWFPPRPLLKPDKELVGKVYGDKDENSEGGREKIRLRRV